MDTAGLKAVPKDTAELETASSPWIMQASLNDSRASVCSATPVGRFEEHDFGSRTERRHVAAPVSSKVYVPTDMRGGRRPPLGAGASSHTPSFSEPEPVLP